MSHPPDNTPDPFDARIQEALGQGRTPRGLPAGADEGEPSDDVVLRVVEGTASAAERAAVAASPLASARAAIVAGALADAGEAEAAPPAVPISARAARYVFAVARDALTFLLGATEPVAGPDLAWATRSSPPAAPRLTELHHRFGQHDAQIRVEHVTRQAQTVDLEVRLVDLDMRPASPGRVTLRRGGRTMDSVPLDASGSALFTGLAPERYEVELRATGQVVGVMVLEFLPE